MGLRSLMCVVSVLALMGYAPDAVARGGDAERGAQLYDRCVACHSLDRNRTGPMHCGLLGRNAGGVPGFAYSKAMRDSGITWTPGTLDQFLESPLKTLPGTKMGYAGIKNPQDRADIIAYLATAVPGSRACH